MSELSSFSDLGKLYGQKLLAERCLLAIARAKGQQPLTPLDCESLRQFGAMLSNVTRVDTGNVVSSLTSDDVQAAQQVATAITHAKLASSRPELLKAVRRFVDIASRLQSQASVPEQETTALTLLLEAFSANIARQLARTAGRQGVFATSSWAL